MRVEGAREPGAENVGDVGDAAPGPSRVRRAVFLAGALAVGLALVLSRPVHERIVALLAAADAVIRSHPVWGVVVFVVLAALSAMVAFFSSALLIPPAVYAWGTWWSFVLLWAGWFSGGVLAYGAGRMFGLGVVRHVVSPGTIARFDLSRRSGLSLAPMLLLQLALPSDVAGYVFGLLRCPLRPYLLALAIAEVPYAAGAVLLGRSFLERDVLPLIAVGLAAVALSWWAIRAVRRRTGAPPGPTSSGD